MGIGPSSDPLRPTRQSSLRPSNIRPQLRYNPNTAQLSHFPTLLERDTHDSIVSFSAINMSSPPLSFCLFCSFYHVLYKKKGYKTEHSITIKVWSPQNTVMFSVVCVFVFCFLEGACYGQWVQQDRVPCTNGHQLSFTGKAFAGMGTNTIQLGCRDDGLAREGGDHGDSGVGSFKTPLFEIKACDTICSGPVLLGQWDTTV